MNDINKLKAERIISDKHPLYEAALKLYDISFPYHEQREKPSQNEILGNPEYHFDIICDGDEFVGEILYWDIGGAFYIEHFCVLPAMRNKHYGQDILKVYQEMPLILEIDPPVDDISKRRKEFYERCGFSENPYTHVHPPYHDGIKGHDLVVMSSPKALEPDEYQRFNQYLQNIVMKNVF